MKKMNSKTSDLLKKAHILINNATGIDVPKGKLDEAKREAKKIYKLIKEHDLAIYNILKEDLNG
jgi:CRISPR/Cas system-associated protein Csx1